MSDYSRVGTTGWRQGDDSTDQSRVGVDGWYQVQGTGGAPTTFIPMIGRGPGMALAGNGGGLAGQNTGSS